MSYKVNANLCMALFFVFFLFLTFTRASRPAPASSLDISSKSQHEVFEEEKVNMEESCEGIGEEDCLMRRTLAAHTDYIYTDKHKP